VARGKRERQSRHERNLSTDAAVPGLLSGAGGRAACTIVAKPFAMNLKAYLLLLFLFCAGRLAQAQPKTPADFGYRHLPMRYQRHTVDILVRSQKGAELKRKPVLLFVQGSLLNNFLAWMVAAKPR
jgi:hypothetical protein